MEEIILNCYEKFMTRHVFIKVNEEKNSLNFKGNF